MWSLLIVVPQPQPQRLRASPATISRLRAIAVVGGLRVSGFPAWVMWLVVHLMTLTGFRNRLSVLFNGTVAFLARGRAQRVITAQQVFARHAFEVHPGESNPALPIAAIAPRKDGTRDVVKSQLADVLETQDLHL